MSNPANTSNTPPDPSEAVPPDFREFPSWFPVDLLDLSNVVTLEPTILTRVDGECLIYPGRVSCVVGEPGCGKSWFALCACIDVLRRGLSVLYIDLEDSPSGALERLRLLQATDSEVARFAYVKPTEPIHARTVEALWSRVRPALVILDGVTSAYRLHDLEPNDAGQTAGFYRGLLDPWAAEGAAVLTIDHVVKNAEYRGGYAAGSHQKKALVRGALFELHPDKPFSRGRTGTIGIVCRKDTPGALATTGQKAGVLWLQSFANEQSHKVLWRIEAPPTKAQEEAEREKRKVDRAARDSESVSRFLEVNPGVSASQLQAGVGGISKKRIKAAQDRLEASGHLRKVVEGRRHTLTVVKPFRVGA